MLTASLGWTGDLPPRFPVNFSLATPAITSLVFMLVEVPDPVWEDVDDELVVVATVGHGLRRLDDRRPEVGVQELQVHVDLRRRLLDQAHRPDHGPGHPQRADLEVQLGPTGLGAEVGVRPGLPSPPSNRSRSGWSTWPWLGLASGKINPAPFPPILAKLPPARARAIDPYGQGRWP